MSDVCFVQANGLRFGYLEAGDGPLVLLVHGFPDIAYAQRRKITVPTVCFAGDDDLFPPPAHAPAASRFTGGYGVVAVPGEHFMHREHPERFTVELLRVLARAR
jgi:pimeloyl-ACP methyl ester carboxylesterase